jgi:dolichyl-phosphate beta-glucosyltransferase
VDLSIVVPAYNEEQRLGGSLKRIVEYLRRRSGRAEVLVVDDGSTDATVKVAEAAAELSPIPIRVLRNGANRGKGFSVRHGMLQARGRLLLFTDADLSAPIEELERLEAAVLAGYDLALGSRADRELIQTHQNPLREFAGRTFNLIVRALLVLPFRDTQCGFKLFRRSAAEAVFPLQRIERWGFDPEILYIARQRGLRAIEVPVRWSHAEGAKIHVVRDSMRMFLDVVRIRWNALCGAYSAPAGRRAAGAMGSDSRAA